MFYITGGLGFVWITWFLLSYRGSRRPATAVKSDRLLHSPLRYRTTWGIIMLGQAGYLYTYYVFATWLPGYLVLHAK